MKRFLPWILTCLFGLWIATALRPHRDQDGIHELEFGRLPVLLNGRVQPFDSVARNSLLQIRGTQTIPLEGNGGNGRYWGNWIQIRGQHALPLEERKWWQFGKHPKKLKATGWVMEVMMKPELADERYIFLIHHPELLSELKLEDKGVEKSGLHYFTFNELKPQFPVIQKQVENILENERANEIDPQLRTPFQKQLMRLHFALGLYNRMKNSIQPEDSEDFTAELKEYLRAIPAGRIAVQNREASQPFNQQEFDRILGFVGRYDAISRLAYPLVVPPDHPEISRDNWSSLGRSLLATATNSVVPPAVTAYAAMSTAYRQEQPEAFNRAVTEYSQWLSQHFSPELSKGEREFMFNQFQPFSKALVIYLLAFLLACASWFNMSRWLNRSAFNLLVLALLVHTFGLVFRMVLEGRPPVTNLYSSAIFVGWGAVVLGLVLERIFRDGIGAVTAASVGFLTQLIAINLAMEGDTMEMMRAVLDTNFWLATHVTIITLGYASTFVAGFLAIIYILRGVFTRTLSEPTAKSLGRMVYGIVCFATLFSFVGTILGGIWADQSWGRFWGWDPKENGALIIVIWNATILHARWGGLVRERGLINMAIFGNIVTSFSWFGVNMLGIGLHSYGFMDKAFYWLMLFVGIQVFLVGLGLIPQRYWRSFRGVRGSSPPGALGPEGSKVGKPERLAAGA